MLGFIGIIDPSNSALRTLPLSSFFIQRICVMMSFPVFPLFSILLQNKKGQVDMHCTALKEEKKRSWFHKNIVCVQYKHPHTSAHAVRKIYSRYAA